MSEPTLREQRDSYGIKPESYFGNPRLDYVAALPADPSARILELGCGDGATGAAAFSAGKAGEYVGIELFEPMAARAAGVLTRVLTGNVETMDLPFAPASFDALIMSEVLEHLVDPYAVVARLLPLLRPGGLVFASSPNVGHWRTIAGLARGRFDYTDSGVMDRTHLRWFTPASFRRMFEEAGLVVDSVAPLNTLSGKEKLARTLLGKRFVSLWYSQITLRGHVPPA